MSYLLDSRDSKRDPTLQDSPSTVLFYKQRKARGRAAVYSVRQSPRVKQGSPAFRRKGLLKRKG